MRINATLLNALLTIALVAGMGATWQVDRQRDERIAELSARVTVLEQNQVQQGAALDKIRKRDIPTLAGHVNQIGNFLVHLFEQTSPEPDQEDQSAPNGNRLPAGADPLL